MGNNIDWRSERAHAIEDACSFFSNKNKLEREKWVVARLLENFIPEFSEASLCGAEEPADVQFQDAKFQVKEIMDDRRRGDEYKKSLEEVIVAKEYGDLLEEVPLYNVSFTKIVNQCYEYSKNRADDQYGVKERENMDFICYFNYSDYNEVAPVEMPSFEKYYRSFSVVSNKYSSVIYTTDTAPEFLKKHSGILYDQEGKTRF